MKQWNPNRPEMPTDGNGNWMDYDYGNAGWEVVYQPFYGEFIIDGMRTGRSSKKVVLKDIKNGRRYPMFVADMVKGIQNGDFAVEPRADGGRLVGWWTGAKRGANYGIKAVKIDEA